MYNFSLDSATRCTTMPSPQRLVGWPSWVSNFAFQRGSLIWLFDDRSRFSNYKKTPVEALEVWSGEPCPSPVVLPPEICSLKQTGKLTSLSLNFDIEGSRCTRWCSEHAARRHGIVHGLLYVVMYLQLSVMHCSWHCRSTLRNYFWSKYVCVIVCCISIYIL